MIDIYKKLNIEAQNRFLEYVKDLHKKYSNHLALFASKIRANFHPQVITSVITSYNPMKF